jgi:hypothetical protein
MRLISIIVLVGGLGGCVLARDRGRGSSSQPVYGGGQSCPPAHHWNGNECVHNGHGEGNGHGHGHGHGEGNQGDER